MKNIKTDVIIISDLRFPGGTSSSIAEEIKAQAQAGYSTGLIHLPSPVLKRDRPFNNKIQHCIDSRYAQLLDISDSHCADLVNIRHPSIFQELPPGRLRIKAERVIVTVNQAPFNRDKSQKYYDIDKVIQTLNENFQTKHIWAPIGPLVRDSLISCKAKITIRNDDWHNILNIDDWRTDRNNFCGKIPVIGRYSRPTPDKWPDNSKDILDAYPKDNRFLVKIMGGGDIAVKIIGQQPANWEIFPFNSLDPRVFLNNIDFFVYYHHPLLTEAFGRTIIEAMAAGIPVILPHHFRTLFNDSCLYRKPSEVKETVLSMYNDPNEFTCRSNIGRQFVIDNFSYKMHKTRLEELIGPSNSHSVSISKSQKPKNKILFISSNGAGLGHVTRLMAIARRLGKEYLPIIVTLSQGMPIIRQEGFLCDYIPSRGACGCDPFVWNENFSKRLSGLIKQHSPQVTVFDGTVPYMGLIEVIKQKPGCKFIWNRRAMWKKTASEKPILREKYFNAVLEPGEFATEFDQGPTQKHKKVAVQVDPIIFLDRDELLSASEAIKHLNLDPQKQHVLIQLGAGNINDISSPLRIALDVLSKNKNIQIAVSESVISESAMTLQDNIIGIKAYPLSKYYRAFDFVISAAGYNSFHELIYFGIPAIFIPNLETAVDDQGARARYADKSGTGLSLPSIDLNGMRNACDCMMDTGFRDKISQSCLDLFPANGAQAAADALKKIAETGSAMSGD